jgi:hypothetical protein
MTMNESLFDRRVVERYRREGQVTDEQIKEYLKKLPDDTGKADHLGSDSSSAPPAEPPPKTKGR